MVYWFSVFLSCLVLFGVLATIWREKIMDNNMDNYYVGLSIFVACIALFFAIILSIDIPSVLKGGEELYVNELPTISRIGHISRVITDNEELRHLKCGDWNEYEKYGNYRITYAKFTKIVLDVEKID